MIINSLAADFMRQPWFIILVVLVFFGLLAIVTWVIYRVINKESIQKGNPQTPEEVANEELSRVLKPFDEEETKNTTDEDSELE